MKFPDIYVNQQHENLLREFASHLSLFDVDPREKEVFEIICEDLGIQVIIQRSDLLFVRICITVVNT
jgi:hypothetical protein